MDNQHLMIYVHCWYIHVYTETMSNISGVGLRLED